MGDQDYSICKVIVNKKIEVQLYFAELPNPVMELFLTGNKNFNIYMRKRSKALGYKLSNSQFYRKSANNSYKQIKITSQT